MPNGDLTRLYEGVKKEILERGIMWSKLEESEANKGAKFYRGIAGQWTILLADFRFPDGKQGADGTISGSGIVFHADPHFLVTLLADCKSKLNLS